MPPAAAEPRISAERAHHHFPHFPPPPHPLTHQTNPCHSQLPMLPPQLMYQPQRSAMARMYENMRVRIELEEL
eukprot:6185039-Pleurochrysis_carterae.AAC.1